MLFWCLVEVCVDIHTDVETKGPKSKGLKVLKKGGRASKELDDILEDNKGRSDADRQMLWRKIEATLRSNDAVVLE